MTTTKVTARLTPQRNVGIIFSTLGFLLWVAIWAQTMQGTRAASVLDMTSPVLLTAISLAFTIRRYRAD